MGKLGEIIIFTSNINVSFIIFLEKPQVYYLFITKNIAFVFFQMDRMQGNVFLFCQSY